MFPTLNNTASFFIQVIPFSFLSEQALDFTNVESMQLSTTMRPMYCSGWNTMYNLDGYATFSTSQDRKMIDGYDQIFRNGIFEVYTSRLFEQNPNNSTNQTVNCMYGSTFVKETLEKINNALTVLKKFHIEAPFIVCISIHNILGGAIKGDRGFSRPFMTDEILLPPIILPLYETDLYKQLKPNFDILWQSVGYSASPPYS